MNRLALALLFTMILMVFSITANAQKQKFIGTFVSPDPATRAVSRLEITEDDQMKVWGRCHPTDCDWGFVPTEAYGPSVVADPYRSAKAILGFFDTEFDTKIVIVTPMPKDRVRISVFTRFRDKSGRRSYVINQILVREGMELRP